MQTALWWECRRILASDVRTLMKKQMHVNRRPLRINCKLKICKFTYDEYGSRELPGRLTIVSIIQTGTSLTISKKKVITPRQLQIRLQKQCSSLPLCVKFRVRTHEQLNNNMRIFWNCSGQTGTYSKPT